MSCHATAADKLTVSVDATAAHNLTVPVDATAASVSSDATAGATDHTTVEQTAGPESDALERAAPPSLAALIRWWPGWRDVVCGLYLAVATIYLVGHDGGRPFRAMLPALALTVPAVAAAWPTARKLPRALHLLGLTWVLGPLVALAFADVRAGWVRPTTGWALAVPAALVTLHLLRRRAGATAVVAIVALALTRAWLDGLLVWWGGGTARGDPAWMALSWHNQSGALMAVLGVGGLGFALGRRGTDPPTFGWPQLLGVIAGATGLAATWLSGSRGAVATAAIAIVMLAAVALRRPGNVRNTLAVTTTTLLAAAAVVAALSPLWAAATIMPDDPTARDTAGITAQPVTAREQGAAQNLRARFGHWEASLRMFASAPLTGTGPGSYQWSSVPVYPDDTNLTASGHGEQLEALGELGLIGGGAALAVSFGLAWLVLGALRRPGHHHLEVAAVGLSVHLVGHAALDFDWDYPILLALLAIAGTALWHARRTQSPSPDTARTTDAATPVTTTTPVTTKPTTDATTTAMPTTTPVFVTAALLSGATLLAAAGATGVLLTRSGDIPWALDGRIVGAVTSAAEGDRDTADAHLAALATWNPGAPRLVDVQALTDHALGDLDDDTLAQQIDPERSAFADQLRAAGQLLDAGRPDLTLMVIDQARPVLDRRSAWGIGQRVAQATSTALAAHHQQGGCGAVDAAWPDLAAWLEQHNLDVEVVAATPASPATAAGEPAWADCQLTMPRGD